MKKLVVMLLVCAAVSSVFASKVKWGTSVAPVSAGSTMYLMYSATGALPDTSSWNAKTSFSLADLTGVQVSDSNGTLLSEKLTSDNSFKWADTTGTTSTLHPVDLDGAGASNGARKFYLAILQDDGKAMTLSTIKTANVTVADATAINLVWTLDSNFTTYKATAGIPEPTSGLLLCLGAAMLALRRRRA